MCFGLVWLSLVLVSFVLSLGLVYSGGYWTGPDSTFDIICQCSEGSVGMDVVDWFLKFVGFVRIQKMECVV